MHKISARLRWYSFKFKTEECSFSSQLNNRLSSCASFNTFIGQYCTITTMYNKKRIEIDIKRDLRASNKFFEGIPVLARFATGPLEEVPPQKERSFPVFFLSLLDPYSSFSSLHSIIIFMLGSVHSFEGRHRRRSSGGYTHNSEPDFQHLLQSRKTTVWNDFGLVKALHMCFFVCDAFLYSIESSKSTKSICFRIVLDRGTVK